MVVYFIFPIHLHCERQHCTVVEARPVAVNSLPGLEPQVCHRLVCEPEQVI